jgi:endoglucanase
MEEALESGVRIGDPVIWNPPTRRIGRFIAGKAMDDRAGLAIITKLLQRIEPANLRYNLTVASTVQEEMGAMVGAAALACSSTFDWAISLEICMAGDTPGMSQREMPTKLGAGPVIIRHDRAVRYNEDLSNALLDCAEEQDVAVQSSVLQRAATNGRELLCAGIPAALVGFTTRYTHSPFEMVAEADLLATVDLLQAFLEREPVRLTYEEEGRCKT